MVAVLSMLLSGRARQAGRILQHKGPRRQGAGKTREPPCVSATLVSPKSDDGGSQTKADGVLALKSVVGRHVVSANVSLPLTPFYAKPLDARQPSARRVSSVYDIQHSINPFLKLLIRRNIHMRTCNQRQMVGLIACSVT